MTDATQGNQAGAGTAATATESATTSHSGSDEAAALWKEFSEADKTPDDRAAEASRAEDVDAAEKASQAQTTTETKAADTGKTGQAAAATEGATTTTAQDIWAQATPEQKAAFEAAAKERDEIKHKYDSYTGRLAAHQQKIDRLEGQLRKQQRGDAGNGHAATDADGRVAPAGFFESAEWKAFETEYPDVAAKQRAAMKPLIDTVESVQRDTKGLTAERSEQQIADNFAAIVKDHPDYPVIKGSDAFAEWYGANKHIPAIADAVKRNGEVAVDPAEVSWLVKVFKADTGWKPPATKDAGETTGDGKGQGKGQETAQGADKGTEGQSQTQAREQTRTETRRETQLESSASPRSTGGGAIQDGPPDDEKGAWEWYAKKGL